MTALDSAAMGRDATIPEQIKQPMYCCSMSQLPLQAAASVCVLLLAVKAALRPEVDWDYVISPGVAAEV